MDRESLISTTTEQNIYIVTFNSNVITSAFLDRLNETLDTIEDSDVSGVIFQSAKKKIFLAGADLYNLQEHLTDITYIKDIITYGQSTFNRIQDLNIPTVAAINGACLGGGLELALACTYRICSNDKSTKLGLPEVTLGFLPAWGGTTRLPKLIGLPTALKLILGGTQAPSKLAKKYGLVNNVVHKENLVQTSITTIQNNNVKKRKTSFVEMLPTSLILKKAKQNVVLKTKGNYPAPLKIIEVTIGFSQKTVARVRHWNTLNKNYEIVVVDNLITGSLENIKTFVDTKKIQFIEQDVQQFIEIEGAVDIVAHLASIASPKAYMAYPVNTLKSGSLGTINSLGLAKAKGAKYLLASTSEVYGDPLISPQTEDYWGNVNPVGPRSMYDESKRFAEAAASTYINEFGLDVKIARIFNTYGTRMKIDDGRVVTNFIHQAVTSNDITIYGDGTQTRSLSYVSDTVEYLDRLLNSDFQGVMNIGNPEEIMILDLAKKIIEKTDSNSTIKFLELPVDDPKIRQPDITLAVKELSYKPLIQLDQGLDILISWVKEKINR